MIDFSLPNELIDKAIQLIFFVTIIIFTVYSFFLGYHWVTYSLKKSVSSLALSIYLLVSAVFILSMTICAFLI